MNILVNGYYGHMGREVVKLAQAGYAGSEAVYGVDINAGESEEACAASFAKACTNVDCIVDFSHHSCTEALLQFAEMHHLPVVIATTAHTEKEKERIRQASGRIPIFFAANYSIGIALLIDAATTVARMMPEAEIEIIEQHHDRKLDAPSGTALAIAEALHTVRPEAKNNLGRSGNAKRTKEEIGIHAVRIGNTVGIHEVLIGTPNQTITLKHEAHDRALFAEGALCAARFLVEEKKNIPGLYEMKDLIQAK